jgi:DNA-directed RNA polymerase subunit RPC12/RpoP
MREKAKEKYIPVKYNPTRICINCGAEFNVGSKSKRELCDYCYKKDLRERKTKTMKDLRNRLW